MNYFSYLSDDDVRYVHESSLEILEEVGLLVRNEKARHRFAEHGANVIAQIREVVHGRHRIWLA